MFSPHSTRFFSASQAFLAGFLGGVDGFTSSFVNNEFATPLHKHFLCSVLGVDSGLGQIWPSLNLFLENLKTRAPSKQQTSSCCCRRCCCWCFLCRFFPGSLVSFLLDSFRGVTFPMTSLQACHVAEAELCQATLDVANTPCIGVTPSTVTFGTDGCLSVFFFKFLGPFQSVESNRIR